MLFEAIRLREHEVIWDVKTAYHVDNKPLSLFYLEKKKFRSANNRIQILTNISIQHKDIKLRINVAVFRKY